MNGFYDPGLGGGESRERPRDLPLLARDAGFVLRVCLYGVRPRDLDLSLGSKR